MAHELTITVAGPAMTGKGVIGMIIEKALRNHGVTAQYRNDDGQSQESLDKAYELRDDILKKIDPQVVIVEEHVGKKFNFGLTNVVHDEPIQYYNPTHYETDEDFQRASGEEKRLSDYITVGDQVVKDRHVSSTRPVPRLVEKKS